MDLFLERTEHAAPPASDASKDWINFSVAEAGQLELSNKDKELAKLTLHMCELEGEEALARAKKALRPWWKRIF